MLACSLRILLCLLLLGSTGAQAVEVWIAATAHPTPTSTLELDNHGRAKLTVEGDDRPGSRVVTKRFRMWPEPDVVGASDPTELDDDVWPVFLLSPDGRLSVCLEPEAGRLSLLDVKTRKKRSWPVGGSDRRSIMIDPAWRGALVWAEAGWPTYVAFPSGPERNWHEDWCQQNVPDDPDATLEFPGEATPVYLDSGRGVALLGHGARVVEHDLATGKPRRSVVVHASVGEVERVVRELTVTADGTLTSRACTPTGAEVPEERACETRVVRAGSVLSATEGPVPRPAPALARARPVHPTAMAFSPDGQWLGGAGDVGWALELTTGRVVVVSAGSVAPSRVYPAHAGLTFLGGTEAPGLYDSTPDTRGFWWSLSAGALAGGCGTADLASCATDAPTLYATGGREVMMAPNAVPGGRAALPAFAPVVAVPMPNEAPDEQDCAAWILGADPLGTRWVAVHGEMPSTSAIELRRPRVGLHLLDTVRGPLSRLLEVPWPRALAFTADSVLLATWDGLFRWNGATLKRLSLRRDGAVLNVAADLDRFIALTSRGQLIGGAGGKSSWRQSVNASDHAGLAIAAGADLGAITVGSNVRLFRLSTGGWLAALLITAQGDGEHEPPRLEVRVALGAAPPSMVWPAEAMGRLIAPPR